MVALGKSLEQSLRDTSVLKLADEETLEESPACNSQCCGVRVLHHSFACIVSTAIRSSTSEKAMVWLHKGDDNLVLESFLPCSSLSLSAPYVGFSSFRVLECPQSNPTLAWGPISKSLQLCNSLVWVSPSEVWVKKDVELLPIIVLLPFTYYWRLDDKNSGNLLLTLIVKLLVCTYKYQVPKCSTLSRDPPDRTLRY